MFQVFSEAVRQALKLFGKARPGRSELVRGAEKVAKVAAKVARKGT